MKKNKKLSNLSKINISNEKDIDLKIHKIQKYFYKIMQILGLDMNNDSLKKTPKRIAKMYVNDIFCNINKNIDFDFSIFKNSFSYNNIVIQKDISICSICEHHFLPIIGVAHIAYIPNKYVIGLSKINRLVNFLSKKPQLQERLTVEIVNYLRNYLDVQDTACIIKAQHYCVFFRGVKDSFSKTLTFKFTGDFKFNDTVRNFFLKNISL